MNKMKAVIIIVSVVVLVSAIASGVWYYKTKFYVPDKNGMVYSQTNTNTQGDD